MMTTTEVILGFDMETDVGSWTHSHRGVEEGTDKLLSLLDRNGVPATFFWVGETARLYPELVRNTDNGNHEAGCHSLYHETVGEPIFEIPGVYPMRDNELEDRLVENKQIVEEAIGRPPVSFRAPRLFGSTNMVNTLARLGFRCDASYPLYHYGARLEPYRPSADDWTQLGDLPLVEIPNFADISMASEDPYGRDRDQWPLFRTKGADTVMNRVSQFVTTLRQHEVPRQVICFYFHPWEFVEMPQGEIFIGEGYVRPLPFIVENCGDYALEQLDRIIGSLLEKGFEFTTCEKVADSILSR